MKEPISKPKPIEDAGEQTTRPLIKKVTADQEVWLKDRIATAIRMAVLLRETKRVAADNRAFFDSLDGIINGTAVEIIWLLGMKPAFINLRSGNQEIF